MLSSSHSCFRKCKLANPNHIPSKPSEIGLANLMVDMVIDSLIVFSQLCGMGCLDAIHVGVIIYDLDMLKTFLLLSTLT
jgi:hypothetical protein